MDNMSAYQIRAATTGGFPVIVHSPALMLGLKQHENAVSKEAEQIANLPPAEKVTVKLLKYSPDELSFDVQCPADGWLLITDRWARSWKGEVNGRQAQVYGGNFIFRAVEVSAGQNRVRLTYRPFAFPWLILLSWGVLAGVSAGAIYRYCKHRVQ